MTVIRNACESEIYLWHYWRTSIDDLRSLVEFHTYRHLKEMFK